MILNKHFKDFNEINLFLDTQPKGTKVIRVIEHKDILILRYETPYIHDPKKPFTYC